MEKNKSQVNYPRYISNKPCGEDLFKNKPHESIANTLKELICNSEGKGIINPVIGLDGDWGSGKSNVIKILEKKLNQEKFFVFTYDVWGHQEDLTRLSFLEEIIEWMLLKDNSLKNKDKWIDKDKKISAKYKKSNRQSFPKIKLMYFWLALIPLSNLIIDTFSENIVNPSAPVTYSQLKIFLLSIFLIFALISFILNIKKLSSKNKKKKGQKEIKLKDRIRNLFDAISTALYFFTGKEIETKIDEYILEDEPSVKRFNSIFNEFIDDIKGDGLIVVFDNMDRLSNKEKLMSIWSSIHTFFAEIDSDFKVWTIIPYDKKNLSVLLSDQNKALVNEFINKTFFLSIRIPNAIYDNWKEYFFYMLESAFSEKSINEDDKDTVLNLFSLKNKTKINPRSIVSFVNDLVTLKILKPKMSYKFLAIYSLEKDQITNNYSIMISFTGLEEYIQFFPDREKLSKCLASIYYNIDEDTAKNILFENIVEDELTEKTANFIENLQNVSFWNWFKKAITSKGLSEYNFSNLILIFNEIAEQYSNDLFIHIYASKMLSSIKDKDIYKDEYDKYLDTLSETDSIEYFTKIIKNTSKEETIKNYCSVMDKLFRVDKDSIKLHIPIEGVSVSAEVYSQIFNEYYNSNTDNFTFLKLIVKEEDLIQYFFENDLYKTDKLDDIKIIEYLVKQKIKLDKIKLKNDNLLPNLHAQTEEIIDTALLVNRLLSGSSELITFQNEVALYNRYVALNALSIEKSDLISGVIKLLVKQDIRPKIPNILSMTDVSESTQEVIQRYLYFSDILKITVQYKEKYLIQLASELIVSGNIQKLHSAYIFGNIKQIYDIFEESVFNKFLEKFNGLKENWKNDFFGEITDLNNWLFLINNKNILKYVAVKKVYEYIYSTLDSFPTDDWVETFKRQDGDYIAFKALVENDELEIKFYDNKDFYDSIKECLILFISDEIKIDLAFFQTVLTKISKRIVNQIVLEIFQKSNSSNPTSFDNDKTLFMFRCIGLYGSKIKDYNSIVDFYLIKVLDHKSQELDIMLEEKDIFNSIVKIINGYTQDKTILINSLDSKKKQTHIMNLINITSLEKVENDIEVTT